MPFVLAIPLLAIAAGVWLLAANDTSKSWLEPLIASTKTNQGGFFTRILTLPAQLLIRAAASSFSAVSHAISVGATHRMGTLSYWLNGHAARQRELRAAQGDTIDDIAHGFERVTGHVIPREIGRKVGPVDRRAKKAAKIGTVAGLIAAGLRKRFNHVLGHEIRPALHSLHHATTVTLPRSIGRIRTRERGLEKEVRNPSKRWLRRIAASMWALYGLGALMRVLAKRFPWLFCRQVKRAMPNVCKMDSQLLDALFLSTVPIFGALSLTSFAREAVQVSDLFVAGLSELLRELEAAAPDYLGPATGSLPSTFNDYLGA